jgi:hypothetical protein
MKTSKNQLILFWSKEVEQFAPRRDDTRAVPYSNILKHHYMV